MVNMYKPTITIQDILRESKVLKWKISKKEAKKVIEFLLELDLIEPEKSKLDSTDKINESDG